jgi:hypothetical protein
MQKYKLLLILILYTSTSHSQNITGCLRDYSGNPIDLASFILRITTDTTKIVSASMSDSEGNFTLSYPSSKNRQLSLHISHLGYRDTTLVFQDSIRTLYPKLRTDKYSISEVVVKADKRPLTFKNGEIIADASFFTNNKGDKIIDLLKRMPGIMIKDDRIIIDGSEPAIVINGIKQKSSMSTIMNYLESASASIVKQVKINTTRLAENRIGSEDATLEIITNTRKLDGMSLTNSSYFQKYKNDANKYGNYTDFLFKNKDLSGDISLGASNRKINSMKEVASDGEPSLLQTDALKRFSYFGLLNMTWAPTKIGGSINLYGSYYKDFSKNKDYESYSMNHAITKGANRNNKNEPDLLSVNVEYDSNDTLHNQFKLSYGLLTGHSNLNEDYTSTLLDQYHLQNKFWGHQHILEAQYGYKKDKYFFKIGSQSYLANLYQKEKIESYNYYSDIKLSEDILALYTSFNYSLTKKAGLYLGIRSEYTDFSQKTSDHKIPDYYWNFSPSFAINYDVSDNYSTSLKLNSRSNRASFYDILPGIEIQNDDEYATGNSELKPEKVYDVRWENLILKYINFRLSFMYIRDSWNKWFDLSDDGQRYSTYKNFGDQLGYYAYLSVPFSFCSDKLRGELNLNGQYEKYVRIKEDVESYRFIGKNGYWNFQSNLFVGYTPNKHLSFYLNPYISSRYNTLQTSGRSGFIMNLGTQYSLLKDDDLTITLSINDLFDKDYYKQHTYYGTRDVYSYTYPNSMNAMITVSYDISKNKKDIKVNRNENDTSRFEK